MSSANDIQKLNSEISVLDYRRWPESNTSRLILSKSASSDEAGNNTHER